MNERWIAEINRMNTSAFNRKARDMLETVGEQPRPDCLHAVQLAVWGITHGAGDDDVLDSPLGETIRAMTAWGPERLKNFFLLKDGQGTDALVPDWTAIEDPLTMAKAILDEIEERTTIHFPWYYDLA